MPGSPTAFPGIDPPGSPPANPAGYGAWTTSLTVTGDNDITAGNIALADQAASNRDVWIWHRIPDWITGSTQPVLGPVVMSGSGSGALIWSGVPTIYANQAMTYQSTVTGLDQAPWSHSGGHTITASAWVWQAGSALLLDGTTTLGATQPAATADPGNDNLLFSTNTCKAWGFLRNVSGTVTVQDGYNCSGGAPNGTAIDVTMARGMANGHYDVQADSLVSGGINLSTVKTEIISDTVFRLHLYEPSGFGASTVTDLSTVSIDLVFHVFGRQ